MMSDSRKKGTSGPGSNLGEQQDTNSVSGKPGSSFLGGLFDALRAGASVVWSGIGRLNLALAHHVSGRLGLLLGLVFFGLFGGVLSLASPSLDFVVAALSIVFLFISASGIVGVVEALGSVPGLTFSGVRIYVSLFGLSMIASLASLILIGNVLDGLDVMSLKSRAFVAYMLLFVSYHFNLYSVYLLTRGQRAQ